MKKLLLIIIASFYLLGAFSGTVFAATNIYESGYEDPCEQAGFDDPQLCGYKNTNEEAMAKEKVGKILNVVYGLIGIVAVIFVIIGGFKYMTSQGEPGRVQQAKNTILFSLIGLVITLSAFAITAFILDALGSDNSGTTAGVGSDDEVTSLTITSGKTVMEGNTLQIMVDIAPDYAKDKSLTFKSSKPTVATISDTGLLYAKKAGTTTVTATASNGVKTSVTITVTAKPSPTGKTTISVKPTSLTLEPGKTSSIEATITPTDACKEINWMSSDAETVSVTNKGIVKAIKEGSATITASCEGLSAKATVTVKKSSVSYDAVWEKRHYTNSNGRGYDYWLNVPEGATSNMALVLFLHGDGEKNSATKVANTAFVKNLHADKGYIGIAPICTRCGEGDNDDWASTKSMTALKGLVDTIISEYKIDTNRVYIWGFSRGSIGTWEMVKRYGSFFRAAVPVSTCGRKTTFDASDGAKFKGTKTYAVVGSAEDTSCMQRRVNYINNAGGSAKIKILSGVNHEKMTNSFPYTEIIDNWLLKQ